MCSTEGLGLPALHLVGALPIEISDQITIPPAGGPAAGAADGRGASAPLPAPQGATRCHHNQQQCRYCIAASAAAGASTQMLKCLNA